MILSVGMKIRYLRQVTVVEKVLNATIRSSGNKSANCSGVTAPVSLSSQMPAQAVMFALPRPEPPFALSGSYRLGDSSLLYSFLTTASARSISSATAQIHPDRAQSFHRGSGTAFRRRSSRRTLGDKEIGGGDGSTFDFCVRKPLKSLIGISEQFFRKYRFLTPHRNSFHSVRRSRLGCDRASASAGSSTFVPHRHPIAVACLPWLRAACRPPAPSAVGHHSRGTGRRWPGPSLGRAPPHAFRCRARCAVPPASCPGRCSGGGLPSRPRARPGPGPPGRRHGPDSG